MTQNFPNLVKKKDTHVQEVQRIQNGLDSKRPTPRKIIIKMTRLKDKERIVKASRDKQEVTYKEHQLDCHPITHRKHVRPEGSGMRYSR